jgi:hypothetical protein
MTRKELSGWSSSGWQCRYRTVRCGARRARRRRPGATRHLRVGTPARRLLRAPLHRPGLVGRDHRQHVRSADAHPDHASGCYPCSCGSAKDARTASAPSRSRHPLPEQPRRSRDPRRAASRATDCASCQSVHSQESTVPSPQRGDTVVGPAVAGPTRGGGGRAPRGPERLRRGILPTSERRHGGPGLPGSGSI